MNKEGFYGNGDFNGNDGDATGKSYASSFGPQENGEVTQTEESEYTDFNNSNKRLDNYFLTFSSWL